VLNDNNIAYINGISYLIKYDLVRPCGYCGVPCLGTYLFWYVHQSERIALDTEKGSIDLLCGEIIDRTSDPDDYALLPAFIRDMNECRGWQDKSDGAVLDINDFLLAIDGMEQFKDTDSDPEHIKSLMTSLRDLTRESIVANSDLWVMNC
jgi:hypothetical protein